MVLRHASTLLYLVLALMTAMVWAPAGARAAGLRVETIVIETASGSHSFATEIADSEPARARGLMFRRYLPADHAMLFVWDAPIAAGMWMKNTFIPLDMLFVATDGRVVHIAADTTPQSLEVITAGRPVRAVIELAGGTAARLGIKSGDRVRHKLFRG
jgi:uncharacterized membrane protein (UPF0127 family)